MSPVSSQPEWPQLFSVCISVLHAVYKYSLETNNNLMTSNSSNDDNACRRQGPPHVIFTVYTTVNVCRVDNTEPHLLIIG